MREQQRQGRANHLIQRRPAHTTIQHSHSGNAHHQFLAHALDRFVVDRAFSLNDGHICLLDIVVTLGSHVVQCPVYIPVSPLAELVQAALLSHVPLRASQRSTRYIAQPLHRRTLERSLYTLPEAGYRHLAGRPGERATQPVVGDRAFERLAHEVIG